MPKTPSSTTEITETPETLAPTLPEPVTTHHVFTMAKSSLKYTATAGWMPIENDERSVRGSMFYVAYIKDGSETQRSKRPITFCFNGGPGSSSVWLHMGAIGPKQVNLDPNGMPNKDHSLSDAASSWLPWTDIVFIDPIGTGYSTVSSDAKREEFHGVTEDVWSVAECIRRIVTSSNRWLSPKFLAGESYGTTRAASLASYLQNTHGMNTRGILLISSVLSFQTIAHNHSQGNDLSYLSFLPSIAATSFFHNTLTKKYQNNLHKLRADSHEFVENDYLRFLFAGNSVSKVLEKSVINRIAELTGLDTDFISACNGRVSPMRYAKELLRKQRQTIGRLDSRYIGKDATPAGDTPENDPSYSSILFPYTAAINFHLRNNLGITLDREYAILTPKVHPWKWGSADSGYVNVADDLSRALRNDSNLRVFIANGYYDLATPYYATEYTVRHLEIEPTDHHRISMAYYEAGHMMYVHEPSLKNFTNDVSAFYKLCL